MNGNGRLLVLSGPTASGKSEVAMALARALPLEIVCADSVQVYRGMDIGSAKPSPGEREEIPHHLIDVADPDEGYNAARYVAEADEAIRAIRGRGRVPLVVGGTGMYIRALLRGLDPLPSDPDLRARLSGEWYAEGGGALFAELARRDPASARKIHPSDRIRVLRALEITLLSNAPASGLRAVWRDGRRRYEAFFAALSPERADVNRRIDLRVEAMFAAGFVDEVRSLLGKGYGPGLRSMGALGYRHVAAHLLRGVPLDRAAAEMKRDTRAYARRQATWLAREEGVVRFSPAGACEAVLRSVKNCL